MNVKSNNKIALSFDIEDWYHAGPVSGSSFAKYKTLDDFLKNNKTQHTDCITDETLRILEILDNYQITATFFIIADVALRYPQITKALKNSKHEIASHSLTHQSAIDAKTKEPLQSKEEWFEDQKKAKEILEDIFEKEIIGFRAPNAYFANWMVPMLTELGFKYDSSIAHNSLYNKTNVDLNNIPTCPYLLNSNTLGAEEPDSTLWELPWSNYKLPGGFILPAGGAFFFRALGYNYFKKVLNDNLRKGDTMFYLHPIDISRKEIPVKNNKSRPFLWINKGEKTEKRLVKFIREFKTQITSCQKVFEKNNNNE